MFSMPSKLPGPVEEFIDDYSEVWKMFNQLGESCHKAGPLDEKSRRLVKLALAIGAGLEGGTHSALRHALSAGITPEEIKHVAILSITTLGFPSAMKALTWINDGLEPQNVNNVNVS
jgi:alkylhydroperoxidase/carboxymuconolactone decarboxylase family protein YurZ